MFDNLGVVYAQGAGTAAAGGNLLTSLVMPMAIFFGIMYFFFIRPQKKKDNEIKNMLESLKPGDRVETYSGLVGNIIRVSEDEVVLELLPSKVRLTHKKFSIRRVVDKSSIAPETVTEISKDQIGNIVHEDEEYIYEEVSDDETDGDIEYVEVTKK